MIYVKKINYHNYTDLRTSFSNVELNGIDIQFYDENNNLVNFNGVNWSITLAIHLTRRIAGDPRNIQIPFNSITPLSDSQTQSLDNPTTETLQPKKDEILNSLE